MIIKEIHIYVSGLQDSHLVFDKNPVFPVYVFNYDVAFPSRCHISKAIESLVHAKNDTQDYIQAFEGIEEGYVRIKFLRKKTIVSDAAADVSDDTITCTSDQAYARYIHKNYDILIACRNLKSFDEITYTLNQNDERNCSVKEFQTLFEMNVHDIFPFLNDLRTENNENFLRFWIDYLSPLNDNTNKNLKEFTRISREAMMHENEIENLDFALDLVNLCCDINYQEDVCNKLTILRVSNDIKTVFEYISAEQYTVAFYIPYQGKDVDMNDIVVEELDFSNIRIYIKLKDNTSHEKILWTTAEKGIKELLLVALDIALAKHCSSKFVFIKETSAIKEKQEFDLTCDAYLQHSTPESSLDWRSKNYLQRIADICYHLNMTTIIEYTGGLALPPQKVNLIKGYTDSNGHNVLRVETNPKESALDSFISHLKHFLPINKPTSSNETMI